MVSSPTRLAPDASLNAPTHHHRLRKSSRRRKPSTATTDKNTTRRTLALMGLLVATLVGLMVTIAYLSVGNG